MNTITLIVFIFLIGFVLGLIISIMFARALQSRLEDYEIEKTQSDILNDIFFNMSPDLQQDIYDTDWKEV